MRETILAEKIPISSRRNIVPILIRNGSELVPIRIYAQNALRLTKGSAKIPFAR